MNFYEKLDLNINCLSNCFYWCYYKKIIFLLFIVPLSMFWDKKKDA